MATGIQTGMRTGSGPLATGRGPLGKPPGGANNGSPLGKLGAMWTGMNPKVRIAIVCVVVLMVVGMVGLNVYSSANQPVELYATKLSEDDVKDVSMKLQEWNIPHQVAQTNDNLLVSPKDKVRAQAQLASHGLPRHAVMTAATKPDSSGINTMSEKEKDDIRKQVLEGELTESMRQMDGVADAYVKLGLPERTLFDNGQEGAKAAVMLKLKPGAQLSRDQITGIVNLVAYSVPDLKAENVKIVDTNGRDLTANLPINGNNFGMAPSSQLEYKLALEKHLKDKVEQQLATVLGAQKFAAQVTAEVDFSQNEVQREVVGGPDDSGKVKVGGQKRVEQYNKDGNSSSSSNDDDGAVQMDTSSTEKKKGTYVKTEESEKYEVNKTISKNVDTSPRIQRLTVSVAVDNLKPDQEAAIAGLVKDAIGINESRGDSVTVKSVPFATATLDGVYSEMAAGMASGNTPVAPPSSGISTSTLAAIAFIPAVLLMALVAVYVSRQRQVKASQSQLILGASTGSASSDIADLLNEKSGKSKAMGETRVNSSDQLERLAKERPNKLAEMIKNTWLSDQQQQR
ncbi:MAG: flagellar basal-body MS-ring/collar protein FliF [Candidatus Bruticola sp.]